MFSRKKPPRARHLFSSLFYSKLTQKHNRKKGWLALFLFLGHFGWDPLPWKVGQQPSSRESVRASTRVKNVLGLYGPYARNPQLLFSPNTKCFLLLLLFPMKSQKKKKRWGCVCVCVCLGGGLGGSNKNNSEKNKGIGLLYGQRRRPHFNR